MENRLISSILRIINATRKDDLDMALKYAKKIIPEEEWEEAEKLIKESFDPDRNLAVGDLVETCTWLPGFITEINGDDAYVFIPGYHDSSCKSGSSHSIKHCAVHKISGEFATKLFIIGEEKLKELWNDPNYEETKDWDDIVEEYYKKNYGNKFL